LNRRGRFAQRLRSLWRYAEARQQERYKDKQIQREIERGFDPFPA
jgi:hypothetical protein